MRPVQKIVPMEWSVAGDANRRAVEMDSCTLVGNIERLPRGYKFDDVEAIVYDRSAGWSSLVARWAHNPKVGGSNPPPATIYGFEGLPA